MLKKKNHHTYNQAACICIAACLLFLSALTACSSEPEPEVMDEEWVPLEINITSIEKMEVSPMSKAGTTELPDIVRMEFREGDELMLYISGDIPNTSVILQPDGSWKTRDGISLMLLPNTNYTISAEYGTELGYGSFGTTDCLQSEVVTPVYNESTKTYTCSFNFTRPEFYSCLRIEFDIMDPGDPIEEDANGHVYVTFTNATLITDGRDPDPFPIINNCLETFYRGDNDITVRGVVLERSHSQGEVPFIRFDPENESYSFTVTPGHITNVLLRYPYPVWEDPNK